MSAFDEEKVEIRRSTALRQAPWTHWVCLDPLDGYESKDCPVYEDPVPLGGVPQCPRCGSKSAIPKEAFEINRQQALDHKKNQW